MTEEKIAKAINPQHPDVYSVTHGPTTLFFKDGTVKAGYFQNTDESEALRKKNIFTFVEYGENAEKFKSTGDKKYVTKVKGEDLERVLYPRPIRVKYNQVFKINDDNTITPIIPVRVGGMAMGAGVSLGDEVFIGTINLFAFKNKDLQGYVDNGMFVITAFYE